jgi:HSP20 family protein
MNSIEETIGRVEQLYAAITGHQPPDVNGGVRRIPPETDPGRHVEEQLGRLLAAVETRFTPGAAPSPVWQPRTIAWQDELAYELAIDVPGVAREQIELRLEGPMLVVRGQRQPPWGDRDLPGVPDACEAPLGVFTRAFPLPERVEPARISARLEAGVLRIMIARGATAEPSQIAITCS